MVLFCRANRSAVLGVVEVVAAARIPAGTLVARYRTHNRALSEAITTVEPHHTIRSSQTRSLSSMPSMSRPGG
jgi:hypothetical protein